MKQYYTLKDGVPGVRLAEKKDEGEIFGLLLMLHAENGMFRMNRDKVVSGIQHATNGTGGIIYVIDDGPRVIATLGMTFAQDWWSDDQYLMERWNYVHPDYRQTDCGRKLLEQSKWAHEWFKQRGQNLPFFCGINTFQRTEAKIRMYARAMVCIGGYFMYGAPPRQRDLYDDEMLLIDERTRKSNSERTKEVRPAPEMLIRVSRTREEPDYV